MSVVEVEADQVACFGELLRDLRQRKQLGQLLLAAQAKLSGAFVALAELDEIDPTSQDILRLAGALTATAPELEALMSAAGLEIDGKAVP